MATAGPPTWPDQRVPAPAGGTEATGPSATTAARWFATTCGDGHRTVDRMRSEEIRITTGSSEVVHDVTGECERFLAEESGDGLLHLWVPHATAGLAVLETGAGSDEDLLRALRDLLPADDRWRHRHGSPGHGRDHVLPAFLPPYASVPVLRGRLALGTWQSICLVDTNGDNPQRQVRLSFLPG
jgi:secondary thiamine-phosphate synthase enzyme